MSKALLHTFIGLGISGGLVSGVAIAGYVARRDVPVAMLAGVLMPTATLIAASVDPLSRAIAGGSQSDELPAISALEPVEPVEPPSPDTLKASVQAHLTMLRPGTAHYSDALSDASIVLSSLPQAHTPNAINQNAADRSTSHQTSPSTHHPIQSAYDTSTQLFKRYEDAPSSTNRSAAAAPSGPAVFHRAAPAPPPPAQNNQTAAQDPRENLVPFSLAIATGESERSDDDWGGDYWADTHAI